MSELTNTHVFLTGNPGFTTDYVGLTGTINVGDSKAELSFASKENNVAKNAQLKDILDPTDAQDAVTLNVLQASVNTDPWKAGAVATSTVNVNLTPGSSPTTYDGIPYPTPAGPPYFRIVIKDQTDKVENGIYDYIALATIARSEDLAVGSSAIGAAVSVSAGNTNIGTMWVAEPIGGAIVGTATISWNRVSANKPGANLSTNGVLINLDENVTLTGTLDVQGETNIGIQGGGGIVAALNVTGGVTVGDPVLGDADLTVIGDALANNFNTSSDLRLKKDIADIEDAVETLVALRPVSVQVEGGASGARYSGRLNRPGGQGGSCRARSHGPARNDGH